MDKPKAEDKKGFTLIIKKDSKTKYEATFREPNFDEIAIAVAMKEKLGYLKAGEVLLNTLWISGDSEIKTDVKAKVAACSKMFRTIETYDSELKKN